LTGAAKWLARGQQIMSGLSTVAPGGPHLFDDDLDAVAERLHIAAEAAAGASSADRLPTNSQSITSLADLPDAAGQ
jgi:hypothetical protein